MLQPKVNDCREGTHGYHQMLSCSESAELMITKEQIHNAELNSPMQEILDIVMRKCDTNENQYRHRFYKVT